MKITLEQLPENIKTTEQFVKRMFFLLWKAAYVGGMGILQDRGSQPEESVWERCKQGRDSGMLGSNKPQRPFADYTFGRMMKFGCEYNDVQVEFRDEPYRSDYQSWCRTYPTAESIKQAVFDSFN